MTQTSFQSWAFSTNSQQVYLLMYVRFTFRSKYVHVVLRKILDGTTGPFKIHCGFSPGMSMTFARDNLLNVGYSSYFLPWLLPWKKKRSCESLYQYEPPLRCHADPATTNDVWVEERIRIWWSRIAATNETNWFWYHQTLSQNQSKQKGRLSKESQASGSAKLAERCQCKTRDQEKGYHRGGSSGEKKRGETKEYCFQQDCGQESPSQAANRHVD